MRDERRPVAFASAITLRVRGDVLRRLAVRRRRHQIVEDARRADDRRLLRMRQRHLDHLDAEERRVRILVGRRVDAARQLRSASARRPNRRCRRRRCPDPSDRRAPCACASRGRSARCRRSCGFAMSVMSKMRMPRSRSLLTVSFTPSRAAVEAAGQILARDEEQVLVDRHVALRRGAEVRRLERRLARVGDVPDLIAVVVALNGVVAR